MTYCHHGGVCSHDTLLSTQLRAPRIFCPAQNVAALRTCYDAVASLEYHLNAECTVLRAVPLRPHITLQTGPSPTFADSATWQLYVLVIQEVFNNIHSQEIYVLACNITKNNDSNDDNNLTSLRTRPNVPRK